MSSDEPDSDPFRPPSAAVEAAVSESSTLPRWERQSLEIYLRHREEPISFGALTLRMIPVWFAYAAILFAAALLGGRMYDFNPRSVVLSGAFGVLLGSMLTSCRVNLRFTQFWPTLRECIDWSMVEKKLAGDSKPDDTGTSPSDPGG